MSITTYYSLKELVRAGREIASGKKTVSFDLFDTLLVRRVHDPDLVKSPVATYIARLARAKGIAIKDSQIQRRRDAIEAAQRAKTGQDYPDHEACYPVFMKTLLQEIFKEDYSLDLLEQVSDFELKMENSMLVPRIELLEWVAELHGLGKKIFVISDMYLPASHLKILLDHAGLSQYLHGIVSSADSFNAKASGTAYPLVAEKYGLLPSEWLHIGDNPISDGLRAADFGITSLVIHDPKEDLRKSIVKRSCNYSAGRPFWRGKALQQLMAPLEGENKECHELYIEGYNFLGPLLGFFCMGVKEKCDQQGLDKIFFLSREGWTFKKYFEAMAPFVYAGSDLPDSEYLYVSRMALAGAACAHQGLTATNAQIAFLPPGNRDFRDICRIFSLHCEAFVRHLDDFGLKPETCLSHIHDGYDPEKRRRFDALLEEDSFQDLVKEQTKESNEALQRYLEDVGFFDHQRVAIVDVGWLGTIQRFLYEAVAHRPDAPQLHGLLLGATRGFPFDTTDSNKIEGLLYDRDRFDLAGSALLYARDVFEEACRAPHPTLNGYSLKDEGYELVFRRTDDQLGQAECAQDRYFAPLQEGMLDSASRFGAAAAILGFKAGGYRPWLNSVLINKLAFPTTKEILRIRNQHHLDDFHGAKKAKKDFYKAAAPLWERPTGQLRFLPFLRLKAFIKHLRARINE